MDATWNAYGVSGQSLLITVSCNERAEMLVAHFRKNGQEGSVGSLYCRALTSPHYERLTPEDDTLTFEDPTNSASSPYVYTNVFRSRRHPTHKGASTLTWEKLVRINLKTKQQEMVLTEADLSSLIGGGERPYVSQVLGIGNNPAGEAIVLAVASQVRTGKGHHADYWIYKMLLDTKNLIKLGQLYDTRM